MSAADILALYVILGLVLAAHDVWDMNRKPAERKAFMDAMSPLLRHPRLSPQFAALVMALLTVFCLGLYVLVWPLMLISSMLRSRT